MRLFSWEKNGCFVSLRPLELDLQPMFCWFSSTNDYENITDQWMLVLYPTSAVISSVISLCFICELIKLIKLAFSRNTILSQCPLWKFQIKNPKKKTPKTPRTPPCLLNSSGTYVSIPPCLRISSSKSSPTCPQNSKKPSLVWSGYFWG